MELKPYSSQRPVRFDLAAQQKRRNDPDLIEGVLISGIVRKAQLGPKPHRFQKPVRFDLNPGCTEKNKEMKVR